MAPGAVSPEVTAMKKRIIMGITGASGAPLAVELLRKIRTIPDAESHVICSRSGALTLRQECGMELEELRRLSHVWYDNGDIGAAVASGSFRTLGMAVVPCSMKTLAGIVTGSSDSLLLRAADVVLKERRRLVLVPRECPLSTLHLRNLTAASELGAVIVPPVPAYYQHPKCIDDINGRISAKVLALFGLDTGAIPEWGGLDL